MLSFCDTHAQADSCPHMPIMLLIFRLLGKHMKHASRVSFISSQLLFIFIIILLNIETMNKLIFFCFSSSCSSPIKMVWLSWQGSQAASLYSARPNLSTASFHQIFVLNPEKWILLPSVRSIFHSKELQGPALNRQLESWPFHRTKSFYWPFDPLNFFSFFTLSFETSKVQSQILWNDLHVVCLNIE